MSFRTALNVVLYHLKYFFLDCLSPLFNINIISKTREAAKPRRGDSVKTLALVPTLIRLCESTVLQHFMFNHKKTSGLPLTNRPFV